MSRDLEKVTYVLPSDLVAEMRRQVARGRAESQTAIVRDAVETYLQKLTDQWMAAEYEAAAKDPRFLADMAAVERDFEGIDAPIEDDA